MAPARHRCLRAAAVAFALAPTVGVAATSKQNFALCADGAGGCPPQALQPSLLETWGARDTVPRKPRKRGRRIALNIGDDTEETQEEEEGSQRNTGKNPFPPAPRPQDTGTIEPQEYFEKQVKLYCGKHAVNNALRGEVLRVEDIRECEQEFKGSIDPNGNWDYHSLEEALKPNSYRFDSIPGDLPPPQPVIINKNNHWFGLRQAGAMWEVVDSLHYPNTEKLSVDDMQQRWRDWKSNSAATAHAIVKFTEEDAKKEEAEQWETKVTAILRDLKNMGFTSGKGYRDDVLKQAAAYALHEVAKHDTEMHHSYIAAKYLDPTLKLDEPVRCPVDGCEFFGSAATNNYCSECYKTAETKATLRGRKRAPKPSRG